MTDLTPLTHVTPAAYAIASAVVSLVFALIGTCSLWRVRKLLAVVPRVEERMGVLSNSVSLLTDTTESCFRALAVQVQFLQSGGDMPKAAARPANAGSAETSSRKAQQRRVVRAAKRGESIADIAAREEIAESEVGLQLHVNREQVHDSSGSRNRWASF